MFITLVPGKDIIMPRMAPEHTGMGMGMGMGITAAMITVSVMAAAVVPLVMGEGVRHHTTTEGTLTGCT
mgnify:CR=1 FL=1